MRPYFSERHKVERKAEYHGYTASHMWKHMTIHKGSVKAGNHRSMQSYMRAPGLISSPKAEVAVFILSV